ncbi:MAG: metalloregulator ArsR/SmtB family transcription factor [Christensenellaceae bacterium]|jgi:ArsR family transcriptional regulator|nr:metalloregulator ArsR/SmtB family transcription factor [Christensenellaceae bacterium]
MENRHAINAKVFKAFCDENRLQILELLQTGEKCACVLLEDLKISQPTLSHHMKILCESGVVVGRKEGKWTHYSISADGAEAAQTLLKKLTTVTADYESTGDVLCG